MGETRKRQSAERWGRQAEALAALLLQLQGWSILDRRARTGAGEIDIVAKRGRVLAFVEVKARGTIDSALGAITPRQRERLLRAAAVWRRRRADLADLEVRFDLVVCAPWRWPRIQKRAFTAESGHGLDLI